MHRALFFGMILLIINGCGVLRPKPTSTISVSNSKELFKQTQRTQPTWETLDLRGSLTARQGDISQRITTTVRISANELIWLNAAVIVPLGRAKIDQSGVAFYEQIGKTFFEGDFSAIEKTLGLALDYTQIENSLRGVPVIATTARKARFASIKDGYVLKSRQGNLRLSNTYNQQFLMTKQLLTLGKQRLVIHYDDYQQISGQWIPMQISYEGQAKGETVQLEFAFRKAEINSEIRTPFSIPKSYTRL
jgi:outer membrane biogenesis lipoprotein LolB